MDEDFECNERLYRGLPPMWIEKDNTVSSAAFKDLQGVSVDRDGGRDEQNCIERLVNAMPKFVGVGRLTCGDVVGCGALPVYCPTKANKYHSEIHNSVEEVPIKPKSKCKRLAQKCQLVFRRTES